MFFIMPVVIMFFIMPVVIMFFIMTMVVVIMPVIIKGTAFTECDPGQTMTVQQGYGCRACRDAIDRLF